MCFETIIRMRCNCILSTTRINCKFQSNCNEFNTNEKYIESYCDIWRSVRGDRDLHRAQIREAAQDKNGYGGEILAQPGLNLLPQSSPSRSRLLELPSNYGSSSSSSHTRAPRSVIPSAVTHAYIGDGIPSCYPSASGSRASSTATSRTGSTIILPSRPDSSTSRAPSQLSRYDSLPGSRRGSVSGSRPSETSVPFGSRRGSVSGSRPSETPAPSRRLSASISRADSAATTTPARRASVSASVTASVTASQAALSVAPPAYHSRRESISGSPSRYAANSVYSQYTDDTPSAGPGSVRVSRASSVAQSPAAMPSAIDRALANLDISSLPRAEGSRRR